MLVVPGGVVVGAGTGLPVLVEFQSASGHTQYAMPDSKFPHVLFMAGLMAVKSGNEMLLLRATS